MNGDDTFGLTFLGLMAVLFVVSTLPVIIAFYREHPNRWVIFIVAVVFGGTGIGWLIALVWSLHGVHRSKGQVANGGESGLNLFANDTRMVRQVGALTPPPTVHHAPLPVTPFPPTVGRGIPWAAEQIERLRRLQLTGAIDETEYAEMKRTILAQC